MYSTTLIPPCYNDGDKQTLIDTRSTTNLAALSMLASLSGMNHEGNVYYTYNKEDNTILIIILDNEIDCLTQTMYDELSGCTGTLIVKGRINSRFAFNYKFKYSGGLFYVQGLNVKHIDVSELDTSNVIDMSYMFSGYDKLTELQLTTFNTSKVTTMESMFAKCTNLTTLDLNNFDTSKVIDMSYMFDTCTNLTTLGLNNFDTSNVENMSYMFSNCANLESIDLSKFDTSNVENMNAMFYKCMIKNPSMLENFNTLNLKEISSMFNHAIVDGVLNLNNFKTYNIRLAENTFAYLIAHELLLSDFDILNKKFIRNLFISANIGKLVLPNYTISTFKELEHVSDIFKNARIDTLDMTNIYASDEFLDENIATYGEMLFNKSTIFEAITKDPCLYEILNCYAQHDIGIKKVRLIS